MENYNLRTCREKIKGKTVNQALKLVWMWTKSEHITFREFEALLCDIITKNH